MEPKPQSGQEELVRAFSACSLGAAFVFVPKKFRKGKAVREPADLVWVCNGVCFLMYMSESRKRAKAIAHNLKQASGWLREWESGRMLEGRNDFSTFAVARSQVRFVVVLSVTDSEESVLESHAEWAAESGVAACCTVPAAVIRRMAIMGCSGLDFVALVGTAIASGPMSERDGIATVVQYFATSARRAGLRPSWVFGREGDPMSFYSSLEPILNVRVHGGEAGSRAIADIPFRETVILAAWFRDAIDKCLVRHRNWTAAVCLSRHDFLVGVVGNLHLPGSQPFVKASLGRWAAMIAAEQMRTGLFIFWDPIHKAGLCGGHAPTGKPAIEELAERLLASDATGHCAV